MVTQSPLGQFLVERNTGVLLANSGETISPFIVQAIVDGGYERPEAELAPRMVRDGDAVLELGAGIGFISTVVCRKRRVKSYLSVEANPALLPLIAETHRLNGVAGVDLLQAFVTSDPALIAQTTVQLWIGEEFWSARKAMSPDPTTTTVPTTSLDTIVRTRAITCIIADIEGGEGALFEGVDLAGVRSVLLELHPDELGLEGVSRIFTQMHHAGLIFDGHRSCWNVVTFSRERE